MARKIKGKNFIIVLFHDLYSADLIGSSKIQMRNVEYSPYIHDVSP